MFSPIRVAMVVVEVVEESHFLEGKDIFKGNFTHSQIEPSVRLFFGHFNLPANFRFGGMVRGKWDAEVLDRKENDVLRA